ncbi:MAG TPA: hypothetical protein VEF55_00190 [Candidatus Binatia bacterium]|nr:hypothetical protein [Candidatus Binatia bacterium]
MCIALAAALLATPTAAQTPLFSDTSELAVTIEAPLSTLIRSARRNTDPHPGTLVLTGQGEPQRYNMLLSARGMSRRISDACAFPPLRVDFENNELRQTIFRSQNRLKLTTHCRPSASYTQYYVLEYTAYRLYNEITPLSFRVRPLRVTYHDTEGRRDDEAHFGFFIEDDDDLARRNDRVSLEIQSRAVQVLQLDAAAATRFALFEFMIGNLDWDMLQSAAGRDCCHNSRLLSASETATSGIVPAPYDFDHSGFVSAPYAVPPEGIPVRNVRDRHYRGYCRFNDQLPAAIALFQERRAAINAVIAGETRLAPQRRQTAQRYIDEFYQVIADPQRVQRQLIDRCRGG